MKKAAAIALAGFMSMTLLGCKPVAPKIEAPSGSALAVLESIPVKKDVDAGYNRESMFGGWEDLDKNGCDSRMEAYKRDLDNIVMEPGTKCTVQSGTLTKDPYIGITVNYVKGQTSVMNVGGKDRNITIDIDHVVPLEDACNQGLCAVGISKDTRVKFANDPYNLITVNSASNRQKGAKSLDEWEALGKNIDKETGKPVVVLLNDDVKCRYAAHVVGVKGKYGLSMTKGEKDALTSTLQKCPNQTIPADPGSWKK